MIRIFSRQSIRNTVTQEPNTHHCVVIYEPKRMQEVNDFLPHCKSYLALCFHDIMRPIIDHTAPNEMHVEEGLQWAADKDDILVACRAGISRSSAMAYLIACARSSPEEAIKILDATRHVPNELMIKHGAKILGEHILVPLRPYYTEAVGYCLI